MNKNKRRVAIKFSPSSKNNLIDKSRIYGGIEMDGEGNRIKRSLIDVRSNIKEHHIKGVILALFISLSAGLIVMQIDHFIYAL